MKTASVVIVRFPFSSQLGGEEIHTFMLALNWRSSNLAVEFLTSCPVLRQFAKENKFKVSNGFLGYPPVTKKSLIVFTICFLPLVFWGFGLVLYYKLTRQNLVFYCLSWTEKLVLSPACYLFKVRSVWVEHARIGNWFQKNPFKIWYKFWAKKSNVTVVTVSQVMQKALNIPCTVVPNAVDSSKFAVPTDISKLPVELKQALQKAEFKVGFIGRLSQDKGIDLLIEIDKQFKKDGSGAKLLTVGKGVEREQLLGEGVFNCEYLNSEEVVQFLKQIDLLVLPALQVDPFGLVVLEALSAKCAVLISDLVGIKDYLQDGTEILVATPEDFVKQVCALRDNSSLRLSLAQQGYAAIERFKVETMYKRYLQILLGKGIHRGS